MQMVHSIVNGHPVSPISMSGNHGGEETAEGEGERRVLRNRKLNHTQLTTTPMITNKGKMGDEERQKLIDKIMKENKDLKEQLGNKVSE